MFNNTLKAKILVLRGLESELPTLAVGQLGYCTDTNRLFIGDAEDGNICINEVDANAVAGAIQNLENGMVELDNTVETLNNQIPGILDDLQRTIDKKSKASATDQGWLETDINKLEIRLFEIIDILKKKKL